jgi:hypothetical protein
MLEAFGTLAAAAMLLCYALEDRGPHFTLAFALSCGAASAYAYAIGSWPLFALEGAWAVVAARRGLHGRDRAHQPTTRRPLHEQE